MKLNYRGDRRNYDPSQLYGPDRFGAVYAVTGAEYDATRDRTALSFRSVSKTEVRDRLADIRSRAVAELTEATV